MLSKESGEILGKKGESGRSFESARHPLREKGRDLFLAEPFANDLRSLVPNPTRIAVFGAGDGKEAAALEGHFPNATIVSMDLSKVEIENAQLPASQGKLLVRGDWDVPPFRDEIFDLIVFFAALHHSTNMVRTLQQVRRTIRPGGWLYATHEPMSSLLLGWFQRMRMKRIAMEECGVENTPSRREYLTSFQKAGFESVSIQASPLNLIRLLQMPDGFEDVRERRLDLPERGVRRILRTLPFLRPQQQLRLVFLVQRLFFGLYGVTVRARVEGCCEVPSQANGSPLCHCERSEAISTSDEPQDCFVVPPRNDCSGRIPQTVRAEGVAWMDARIVGHLSEDRSETGNAFAVAKAAGASAAEETARLILEDGLPAIERTKVTIEAVTDNSTLGDRSLVRVEVSLRHRFGCKAEMAVLTAVSAAMLALRDACKAVGGEMEVTSIRLL